MRFLAILMVCVVSLLVVGCGEDSFDRTEYAFPVGYTPTVVVVEQEIPEAYNIYNPDSEVVRDYKTLTTSSMETSVYEDTYTAEEKEAVFNEWKETNEALDKYNTLTDVWSRETFEEQEQERIEEYCEEHGFFSCYDIKYTCEDEYDCHKVYITCETRYFDPYELSHQFYDRDTNDECRDWEVDVDEDTFDWRDVDDSFLEDAGYQW